MVLNVALGTKFFLELVGYRCCVAKPDGYMCCAADKTFSAPLKLRLKLGCCLGARQMGFLPWC